MIDTHTHLYLPEFAADAAAGAQPMQGCCDAVDRAVAAGVEKMILPCVDRSSVDPMRELHRLRPDVTALAMGLHPTEVRDGWPDELAYLMGVLSDGNPYCAVGEIGIDLYWDRTFEDAQMQVFDRQLDVAAHAGLPVIIHCREALDPTLEVLSDHPEVPAVFHSFGGTVADVDRIRALGDYYFGINGIVTFKNSGLRDVLPAIGLDRILTETDSPYLAPVPHRGKRNESSFIPLILAQTAAALGVDTAVADAATTANARRLFKI